jgi:hypothetical protein
LIEGIALADTTPATVMGVCNIIQIEFLMAKLMKVIENRQRFNNAFILFQFYIKERSFM